MNITTKKQWNQLEMWDSPKDLQKTKDTKKLYMAVKYQPNDTKNTFACQLSLELARTRLPITKKALVQLQSI